MTPKVCILNEEDARAFTCGDIAHRCSSRRHHHFRRERVNGLVKSGDLVWIGKHKKAATYREPRAWVKVYIRNRYGEVLWSGMQLVRGSGH